MDEVRMSKLRRALMLTKVIPRPLLAAEIALDLIHRMQDGYASLDAPVCPRLTLICRHDELAFGLAFRTPLAHLEFKARLLDALIQLRFSSPLVAASIGTSPSGDRIWKFRCSESLSVAREWAESTLQVSVASDVKDYATYLTSKRLPEVQPPAICDQVFGCHLVIDSNDSSIGLLVYGSHCLLDGPGCLSMIKLLLRWILAPETIHLEELRWGDEGMNLPPGPMSVSGRGVEDWERDGGEELLKRTKEAFADSAVSPDLRDSATPLTKYTSYSHHTP